MDDRLRVALAPVLSDLRAAGFAEPRIEDSDWTGDPDFPSAMVGGHMGVSVGAADPVPVQIARAADMIQEWLIDELWEQARPTNWPVCPRHRHTHPMEAVVQDDVAVWVCPTDGRAVVSIGGLVPADPADRDATARR